MPKYIFVTGGVVSSLGKGLAASSIGSSARSAWFAGHLYQARPVYQRRSGNHVARFNTAKCS